MNPRGSIGQSVNAAVETPAGLARAMPPAPPGLLDASKGRRIDRCGAPFGLRSDQAHFFPFPGPFAFAGTAWRCADHCAIALGDDMFGSERRQHSKRLGILFFQLLLGPMRVSQSGPADRA